MIAPMNPNWFGILCAACALLAFFMAYRRAQKLPPKKRIFWTLAALLLALPGATFAAYYAHLVPVPAWYYEFRSWRGTEALLIFIGIACGLLAAQVASLARILVLLIVVIFVTVPFVKPFLGPFAEGALQDRWSGEVCLQSTYSTCGAASAATLLRQHGITVSESEIAKEAHSYTSGTEIWYLARALRKRGLTTQMHVAPASTSKQPGLPQPLPPSLPAVAGVTFGHTGHFITLLSQEGDNFHVGDPLRGSEILTRQALLARYQFTGFSMSVGKP